MNPIAVLLIRASEVFLIASLGYMLDSYAIAIVGGAVLGLVWANNDRQSDNSNNETNS